MFLFDFFPGVREWGDRASSRVLVRRFWAFGPSVGPDRHRVLIALRERPTWEHQAGRTVALRHRMSLGKSG